MTPASVTMYFWSGCQVETLWCEPHHELTRIFKLPLRVCFQNECWRCLVSCGFMCTESPLLWTAQPENAAASFPCSVFLQSLPVLITGSAGGSQPSSSPFFISVSPVSAGGDQKKSTWRRPARRRNLFTFISMKTPYFFS